MHRDPVSGRHSAGHAVPAARQLIGLRVGSQSFRKIRVCQSFLVDFIRDGDHACIYVYKQLGITDVIVGVRSSDSPSYAISLPRMLMMIAAQFVFGTLIGAAPAFLLLGWISTPLALLSLLVLPAYGSWTLCEVYQEMSVDFS